MLLLSFIFFSTVVTLRLNRSLHWQVVRDHKETLFKFDILQYQTLAFFSDRESRHHIAQKLLKNTFFSPIYTDPGIEMLKDNADDGYAPSQVAYGDYLSYRFPLERNHKEAITYFEMAASQGYEPAQERLQNK